ncbi:MAG: crossover junction endodeoxyribonuclease RuvC [Planctomycetaceae bacterium]|nr:crossover junction endodeoxyribonuclease RuvC [Planctomycetaceae bacterium]
MTHQLYREEEPGDGAAEQDVPRHSGPVTRAGTCGGQPLYLGVDPGLRRTGYALLDRTPGGPVLREGGVIRSKAGDSLARRVYEIGSGLKEVLEEFRPWAMAIEQVFSLGRNPKSALLMAHARGAILMAAAELDVPVLHYTPTQVKKLLTGSGKANKLQMQQAVQSELKLPQILEPNDVADASAVAVCLYYSVRFAA